MSEKVLYGSSNSEEVLRPPPGLIRLVLDIAVFTLFDEVLFFYGHWALHSRWLYAPIHKKHHEWKSTVALAASYSNPVEFAVTGLLPGTLVQLLLAPHVTSIWLYRSVEQRNRAGMPIFLQCPIGFFVAD